MTAREIWDGEVFVGFAAPYHTIGSLEILIHHSCLSYEEQSAIYLEIGQPITVERAAHLREYLEQNQQESPDPRTQNWNRKKIQP